MLAIIIILLLVLIVILLMIQRPKQQEPAAVYVIGSRNFDNTVWPASYWNWFSSQYNWEPNASRYGGARGWGSRPEYRRTAGPGYKPAGNYGPRYSDRHRPSH
jgi:hypothetical protein